VAWVGGGRRPRPRRNRTDNNRRPNNRREARSSHSFGARASSYTNAAISMLSRKPKPVTALPCVSTVPNLWTRSREKEHTRMNRLASVLAKATNELCHPRHPRTFSSAL
jgi:hypothetical protein